MIRRFRGPLQRIAEMDMELHSQVLPLRGSFLPIRILPHVPHQPGGCRHPAASSLP